MKKLLIIIKSFDNELALIESIELGYSQAAFGHLVTLVLFPNVVSSLILQKERFLKQLKMLNAWELYEIENLFAITEDEASENQLAVQGLSQLENKQLRKVIDDHDEVLVF